jgi:transposase-like protein
MVKHAGSTVNKWNTKYFPDIVTAINSKNFLVSHSVDVHKHDLKGNILSQA